MRRIKIIKLDKKIRIFLFSDFATPKQLKENMENVFQKGVRNYKDEIEFVDSIKIATHIIVINRGFNRSLLNKIPKENILFLSYEPNIYFNFNGSMCRNISQVCNRYLIGTKEHFMPDNFISHYGYMWHSQIRDEYFENILHQKKHTMSITFSKKRFWPGHKYRHLMVKKILETNLDVHIWGKGCSTVGNDTRIKGEFDSEEPYQNYHFTIAFENNQSDCYISEKFTSPIANNCIPVYWGAKKVNDFFGKNCCYKLTGNIEEDMKLIEKICLNCEEYLISLKQARYELFEGKAYLMKYLHDLWIKKII